MVDGCERQTTFAASVAAIPLSDLDAPATATATVLGRRISYERRRNRTSADSIFMPSSFPPSHVPPM